MPPRPSASSLPGRSKAARDNRVQTSGSSPRLPRRAHRQPVVGRRDVRGGVDAVEIGMSSSDPLMDGAPAHPGRRQHAPARGRHAPTTSSDGARVAAPAGILTPSVAVVLGTCSSGTASTGSPPTSPRPGAPASSPRPPRRSESACGTTGTDALRASTAVFLVAPSSTDDRVAMRRRRVERLRPTLPLERGRHGRSCRRRPDHARPRQSAIWPPLPVAVGVGVSTAHQAAEIAAYADGVIVGAALVPACSRPTAR